MATSSELASLVIDLVRELSVARTELESAVLMLRAAMKALVSVAVEHEHLREQLVAARRELRSSREEALIRAGAA